MPLFNQKLHPVLSAAVAALFLGSCGFFDPKEPPKTEKKTEQKAEKKPTVAEDAADEPDPVFGDIAVVPVPLADFSQLPVEEQYRIALLSRTVDSAADFRTAGASEIEARARTVLSAVLQAESKVPPNIFEKVGQYAVRYRLHGGPEDAWTGAPLNPAFIPGELAAAAHAALQSGIDLGLDQFNGADLGANRLEQLDLFLASIRPLLFGGTAAAPAVVDTDSAHKSHVPISTVGKSPEGAAAVKSAAALLPAEEREAPGLLADYLETGAPDRFTAYLRSWSKQPFSHELVAFFDRTAPGESPYTGRFQIIAAVEDPDHTPMVQKIAEKAEYFERLLPGNAMFKRPLKTVSPPIAAAYRVVAADPWSAPVYDGAFTYPVPRLQASGKTAKVLLFLDAAHAREKAFGEKVAAAFSADDQTRFLRLKWREAALSAYLILKNVVGYTAGIRKAHQESTPLLAPARLTAVLEEIHSDLVALHFAFDPEVQATGLVPEPECARALLIGYVSGLLEQAGEAVAPDTLSAYRAEARRAIVRGLIKTGAVAVESRGGSHYAVLLDEDAARKNIAAQLAEVRRMVALGALGDAQTLLDTDGGPLPAKWRADARTRLRKAGVAPKTAYLFPRFHVTKNDSGTVKAVSGRTPTTLSEWVAERTTSP